MTLLRLAGLLLLLLNTLSGMAQSPTLSLTGYVFTPERRTVGTVKGTSPITRCAVQGPSAALVAVDGNNQLTIKPEAVNQAAPWYDVVVEATTNRGAVRDTFRIVRDTFIRNPVIAHRGAWKQGNTTENSLASLQNAIKLGCMGSEFDVHMSADSVLFVNHDGSIQGKVIEKTPAAELALVKLDNGEPLPMLEAYLREGTKQTRTKLILEIKTSRFGKERSLALTQRVVDLVHRLKAQAWVDYIAFDYDVCLRAKALSPAAQVTYLNGDKTPAELAADHLNGFDYHVSVLRKNENWIPEAHQLHLTTNAWTVNSKADLTRLLEQKIDYITTNEPELLLTMIQPQTQR